MSESKTTDEQVNEIPVLFPENSGAQEAFAEIAAALYCKSGSVSKTGF